MSDDVVLAAFSYIVCAMLFSAMEAKVLGCSIVFVLGICWLAQFEEALGVMSGLYLFYVPACLLAAFRS